MRLFYFPMVDLRHIPCRHMLNKYEGHALYSSLILNQNYFSLPYSLGASLSYHRSVHIKVHINGSHIQFMAQLYSTTQSKVHQGISHNGDKKLSTTFIRYDLMPFQPINLKSIIHQMKDTITANYFMIYNLTTWFKVPHK